MKSGPAERRAAGWSILVSTVLAIARSCRGGPLTSTVLVRSSELTVTVLLRLEAALPLAQGTDWCRRETATEARSSRRAEAAAAPYQEW